MEMLLSVAFDNLSSYDGPKIKKGLRQVEGLLAQICLSAHAAKKKATPRAIQNGNESTENSIHSHSRSSSNNSTSTSKTNSHDEPATATPKPQFHLSDLTDDAAFREFFKLQDGFQWNIAQRLIQTLDRLLAKSDDGSMDLLMLSALDSLQGVLLLHPPSRLLFSREQSMNLLLDLLEPVNCPAIQSATLLVLVAALLETPCNTRTFENLDGLLTVSSIFKSRSTAQNVKFKTMEFLYFYLMPETPSIPRADARDSVPALLQRSPSKLQKAFGGGGAGAKDSRKRLEGGESETFCQEEKQEMLRRHLPNVDELVKDLQRYAPFGGAVA